MSDAEGGYYTDGKVIDPLRTGAASFVVYSNGSSTVGQWGRDVSMGPTVVSVRQNLDLLVDNGSGGCGWAQTSRGPACANPCRTPCPAWAMSCSGS